MRLPSLTEQFRATLDERRAWRTALKRDLEERSLQLAELEAEIAAREAALSAAQDAAPADAVQADAALGAALAGSSTEDIAATVQAVSAPILATVVLG